jgi:hypothetical protein
MKNLGRALALCLISCITPADVVRQRASLERGCPENQVTVTDLPGGAFRADGCGKSEVFVCLVQNGSTQTCTKEQAPVAQ